MSIRIDNSVLHCSQKKNPSVQRQNPTIFPPWSCVVDEMSVAASRSLRVYSSRTTHDAGSGKLQRQGGRESLRGEAGYAVVFVVSAFYWIHRRDEKRSMSGETSRTAVCLDTPPELCGYLYWAGARLARRLRETTQGRGHGALLRQVSSNGTGEAALAFLDTLYSMSWRPDCEHQISFPVSSAQNAHLCSTVTPGSRRTDSTTGRCSLSERF